MESAENTSDRVFIDKTIAFVKEALSGAEGGHDWWHAYRIWKLARHIAKEEGAADMLVVELSALLHDIADAKFHDGDETIGPQKTKAFLESLNLEQDIIEHVVNIVANISYRHSLDKSNDTRKFKSPEFCVVQDADRLDAMGAIGIARTFNYGGHKSRAIYDPAIKANSKISKEEYKNSKSPTINHFYEKLLLLKDSMNTKTARQIAKRRHKFMEKFLEEFYKEWEAEL